MNKRAKLVSLITSFCLMLTLMLVGVFAVRNTTVPMGGQINFSATGINAKITYIGTTGGTLAETLPTLEYSTHDSSKNPNDTTLGKWGDMNLTFADGSTELYVEFTVQNLDTKPLYVTITTPTVPEGMTITPVTDLTAKTLTKEVAGERTITYYVLFTVTDDLYDIENARFDVNVDLSLTQPVEIQAQMKSDVPTEVDYYYVTMGTYNSEPVRWRYVGYVAEDGTYTSATVPVSGKQGIFVQETYTRNEQPFLAEYTGGNADEMDYEYYHTEPGLTNVYANDYATSDIRKYLTATDETSLKGYLHISDNDVIYSNITRRTLEDLYSKASTSGEGIVYPTDTNVPAGTTEDKLWLLSYQEINTLVGDNNISNREEQVWKDGSDEGHWYWLRTPMTTINWVGYNYSVDGYSGGMGAICVDDSGTAPRPAFLLPV